ncbi:hypothetical protein FCM35_KLT06386 [Carex littledalei]|uniref:DUF3444 domain-containing protein n=1 Tax=Carex littledalei TaxID=544730 RepID=A0A833VID7_9POAL|nr:hypothetical protein FCM35_KLT06386 [Carex littledalei]
MPSAKVIGLNPLPEPNLADDRDSFVKEREQMAATLLMAKKQAALRKYTPLKRGSNKILLPHDDPIAKKARKEEDDSNRENMVVETVKDDSGQDPFIKEREEMAAALLAAKKRANKSGKKGLVDSVKLPTVGGDGEKKESKENESAMSVVDLNPLSMESGVQIANRHEEISYQFVPITPRPIRIRLTKEFPLSDIRKMLVERARIDLVPKLETLKNMVYEDISILDVPDPEFHDFDLDRTRHAFQKGQVWACYDDDNGMPRFYAFVQKILSSKRFKIRFSYLKSPSTAEFGRLSWIGSGFVKTLGHFRVEKKSQIARAENLFSHRVDWERGPQGTIRIFPRCGEIWALYKNWSADWGPLTPDEVIHEYEMVEVVEEYNKKVKGCCVVPLVKVNGFTAVYKRVDSELGAAKRMVKREEMLRFSHRVPAFKLDDGVQVKDGGSVPDGCFELDPAALLVGLLQAKESTN